MASDFIYFISTLPTLTLPAIPGDTWNAPKWEEFLDKCRSMLSEQDAAAIAALKLCPDAAYAQDPQTAGARMPRLAREWYDWQIVMRNALARRRAQRLERHSPAPLPEAQVFPNEMKRLDALFEAQTPVERAWAWYGLQWRRLDELSSLSGFSMDSLIAYALKVLLANEAMRYDRQAGAAAFASMTDGLVATARERRVAVQAE